MKDFLKEIIRLWWVEGGVALKNPKSEASIKALRTILREDLDFPNEAIEYIIENIKNPITHFVSDTTSSSGINVGKNQSAVSAKLHPDWDDEDDEDDGDLNEAEKFSAIKNDTKNRTDFGSKEAKDAAIAAGTHTDINKDAGDAEEDDSTEEETPEEKLAREKAEAEAAEPEFDKAAQMDMMTAAEKDSEGKEEPKTPSNKEVKSSIDKFKEFLNSEQLKALELEGRRKVKRLKELDSLRDSFSELTDEVRNTSSVIFAKGQTYEGRPNSGIGKNVLGYLDVKTLSENKEYLLKAYGDGSAKHIKKFVRDSRSVNVSEDYVNSAFDLLPDSFQKALSGKGMTGDDGKGKHFLGYITEDGNVTSDKNDPSIKKDTAGNLEVKRGNPPSKDRGKFVWRAILEQGGKDPYTGLPLDLANIDLEHTIAFDNNDNGEPTEQDYLNREHDDNIIICATNINQKKSNLSMKDFIESQVDVQSGKSESEFTVRDDAYSAVNNVASQTEQKAGLMIEEGKLKKGLTSKVLKESFSIDDKTYDDARDTFKEVVKNKRDQKKISTLKSELGKDTLMAMGLGRGLTKKSGRGTVKLSSDNLYRGFLLSMADNPDRQDEYKEEWENARKVGNSDKFRLAGKGQKGMISYLIDKGLISDSVLKDKKMGKVFQNALKEIYDEVSDRYILVD
jgi:hypothetical protein